MTTFRVGLFAGVFSVLIIVISIAGELLDVSRFLTHSQSEKINFNIYE